MAKSAVKPKKIIGLRIEKKYSRAGFELAIGVDEAGRGPLAGPVFAAAAAIKNPFCRDVEWRYLLKSVNDSKKIGAKKREIVYQKIICHPNIVWASAFVGNKLIDKINILQASKLAMERAVKKLKKRIGGQIGDDKIICLIDGNFAIKIPHPQKPIIGGDGKVFCIAAASIIAKVQRDCFMEKMDKLYSAYGFTRHKGYGTKQHLAAIKKHGDCPIHRRTFAPIARLA